MDLADYRQSIEQELKAQLGNDSSDFYNMMRYHLGWTDVSGHPVKGNAGKLLRPVLCLLSCEAVGGKWDQALPAAAAIELLHNFSLIHDDIEDSSRYRRHRRTVWDIWGQAQAINTGDGMYAFSRLGIVRLIDAGHQPDRVLSIVEMLDHTCVRLCEGQYSDMCFESRQDISVDEYIDMISKKTANLISCSLKIGAMLGTGDMQLVEDMSRFGFNLGMAFQIKDDILGIWGEEDITGKSNSDIAQRKKTLPIVYALNSTNMEQKEIILRIYKADKVSRQDEGQVIEALNNTGAHNYCIMLANEYYNKAVSLISRSNIDSQIRSEFLNIASFIVSREY